MSGIAGIEQQRVRLKNVRHGSRERGRDQFIYADLVDAETGHVLIAASLDYIMHAVAARGHVLVGDRA